jgi:catechol 2,3-dioxygenase
VTASSGADRLPPDTGIAAATLQVTDISRSLDWYARTLGFSPIAETSGRVTLGTPGSTTPLLTLVEHAGGRPVVPYTRLGLYHVAILLPSRAALGALVRHLGAIGAHVASADHAVSEALYLNDPDGLGLEVYADRPRSAWTTRGTQVVMTVERLDLRGLAAAAEGPWTGLPAGTAIGHVHLHVGNLDDAAAFYQQALGFDETMRMQGALFLATGGYHHHLGLNTWAADAVPPAEDEAQLLEWTLRVPDASAAAAAAARLVGARYVVQQQPDGWTARDPWQTPLRVVFPTPADDPPALP